MIARMLVAGVLVGAMAPSAAAHDGGGDFVVEETIQIAAGGLLNALSPCDSGNWAQGLDGYWIELPAGAEGHRFELDSTDGDTYLFFWDASCGPLATHQRPGPERGHVPDDAAWAFVTGAGLETDVVFTFVVEDVLP